MRRLPPEHPGKGDVGVEVVCHGGLRPLSSRRAVRLVRRALAALGKSGSISLLFTGDQEVRRLNRKFCGIDRSTDVLSFPWTEAGGKPGYLGDIVISVEKAARYARQAGWSLEEEIQFLILHGLLHLLGHDHEVDSGAMNRIQSTLARELLGREIPARRLLPSTARSRAPRRLSLRARS